MVALDKITESASRQEWVAIGASGYEFIEHNGNVLLVKRDNRGYKRVLQVDEQTIALVEDTLNVVAANVDRGNDYIHKLQLCTEDGSLLKSPVHTTKEVLDRLNSFININGHVMDLRDASNFISRLSMWKLPNAILMNVIKKGDDLIGGLKAGEDSMSLLIEDGKVFVKYP